MPISLDIVIPAMHHHRRPLAENAAFGFDSFMVNGPDGVLVEIVEAEPIPDGLWR